MKSFLKITPKTGFRLPPPGTQNYTLKSPMEKKSGSALEFITSNSLNVTCKKLKSVK